MVSIVTTNVSQQVAPTPSLLQQTGAFISQGGTNTAPGTISLLTQSSDFTSIVNGAHANASLTWASSIVTVTTAAPHNMTIGDVVIMTISGVTPSGYNGTYNATITGTATFTYPQATTLASASVPGVYTLEDVAELQAMVNTFFGMGAIQAVYVLELGAIDSADAITALAAFIVANPNHFYSYLVPRDWANQSSYWAFLQLFESPSSKTYFFTTMTLSNYTNFTALMKDVVGLVEAPGVPVTEFTLAAPFYKSLSYAPSTTNKVTPFAFSFLFGVTPYPTFGNSALLTTLQNAGVNFVLTGAEGGISNAILWRGTTMDLRDFTYWYSADWVQINADLFISNAIINGSNNPINPLYYNQPGINRLEKVLATLMNDGVTFGLVLFTAVELGLDGPVLDQALDAGTYDGNTIVNAVPFITYSQENPGDYKIGRYSGLSCIYVPSRGFISIIFNLVVSDFVAP